MAILEREREIFPLPQDLNKFEINKLMRAMGLPIPKIYKFPEEVEAVFDSDTPVFVRGYVTDKKAHTRPFCADEVLIDVLDSLLVFSMDGYKMYKEDLARYQKRQLRRDTPLAVYCEELGIDPADIEINCFFQRAIRTLKPREDMLRLLTADFLPSDISVEGQIKWVKFGNLYASKLGLSLEGFSWIKDQVNSAVLLHRQAKSLLSQAFPGHKWHLEMAGIRDNDEKIVRDFNIVQARRIPFDRNFLVIKDESIINRSTFPKEIFRVEGVEMDINCMNERDGVDLRDFPPYFLILRGHKHDEGTISLNNRYGKLLGVILALPGEVQHKLLSHDYYRLLALTGTKGGFFIINGGLDESEFVARISRCLGISCIYKI